MTKNSPCSGIRGNRPVRGTVASFLKGKIRSGSGLSFVSVYALYGLTPEEIAMVEGKS